MLGLGIFAFTVGLLYWMYRAKKQNLFKRHELPKRHETKIDGSEVRAFLDMTTSLDCLKEDGTRFGPSFRLTSPPPLPHPGNCQCKIVPISYTSTEVFQGEGGTHGTHESALGLLKDEDAQLFKKMLLGFYVQPLPATFEVFCQPFEIEKFTDDIRARALALMKKKFETGPP